MRESKRKTRLFALSSIDCPREGPRVGPLRARGDRPLCALGKFENRMVVGAYLLRWQLQQRGMEEIYES